MNDNGKALIVFPEDASTVFLGEIISYLFANVHTSLFDFFRVKATDESHSDALKAIQKSEYNPIIFLGHGTSASLHGARNSTYKNEKFVSNQDLSIVKGKRLMLVSCESCSLIKKARPHEFTEAIGFGDLPTDWNDIQSARELDASAYNGFTEPIMELFKKSLVEIIKYSLVDFFNHSMSFKELHDVILLRINKRIASYFVGQPAELIVLTDCLLKMKHELIHFVAR